MTAAFTSLTGNYDMDRIILLELPDYDIIKYHYHAQFSVLISDEFLKLRVNRDYPNALSVKPDNEDLYSFWKGLIVIPSQSEYKKWQLRIIKGLVYSDILQWAYNTGWLNEYHEKKINRVLLTNKPYLLDYYNTYRYQAFTTIPQELLFELMNDTAIIKDLCDKNSNAPFLPIVTFSKAVMNV